MCAKSEEKVISCLRDKLFTVDRCIH